MWNSDVRDLSPAIPLDGASPPAEKRSAQWQKRIIIRSR